VSAVEVPKKLDYSYYNLYEAAIFAVCQAIKDGDRPSTIRMNLEAMTNLLLVMRPQEREFIEEESRTYLVLWTPIGRVLVWFDTSCKQYQGFLACRNPDKEIELVLAA
jgi:hypothetical protein